MTIPIDEETILFFVIIIAWSNNHIASFNKFDNVSHAMTALKLVKKCAARSEFLFCLFSRFRHSCSCPECASRVSGIIFLEVHQSYDFRSKTNIKFTSAG